MKFSTFKIVNLHNFKFLCTKFKYQVEPFTSAELFVPECTKKLFPEKIAQILGERQKLRVTATTLPWKLIRMNISQPSGIGRETECKSFLLEGLPLLYPSTDSFYGLLIAAAVFILAACPLTISLNALVMVAVKTRGRLQTHPNILLACLALTDLMVGLFLHPIHITKTVFLLQEKDALEFCEI